jgi:Domain of unknown function (DUF4129)
MPMRRTSLISLSLVLFFVPATRCVAAEAAQSPVSTASSPDSSGADVYLEPASFAAELQRIGSKIETNKANPARLAALRKDLPSHWEVVTQERRYSISAESLNALLQDAEKAKDAKSFAAKAGEAAAWAFDLAAQVRAYAGADSGAASGAAAALQRILNRREFGAVKGPSAWDLLKQRIYEWIANVFLSVFQQVGRYPMSARIFFWAVIVAVVVWLAMVLFRYWTRKARLDELEAPDSVAYLRTWQEWIQASREAAARGDYREAVHSAYWAGISFLEDREVVGKDRTRTPREYVRLVSNSTQLMATGRKTRDALSALTVTLEQVWYGRKPASNQDFANALQSVEALGCQLQ